MEAIHGMKIYAMTEEDWYVAPTMQEALAEYCAEMCATEAKLREDGQLPSGYPLELSEADIDRLKITIPLTDEDDDDEDEDADASEVRTFRQHLTLEPPATAEMFCSRNY